MRPDPLDFLSAEITDLKAKALYRPLRVMSGAQEPETIMDGRPVISLSSNNYLGLATHPHLVQAALAAVRDLGVGSGAVRTIAGTMELHEELERRLAVFKHTEAVLIFQSGFTANSGVIPTITGEGDLIVSDELNHASIIDGMRLSKAAGRLSAPGRGRAGERPAGGPGQGRPGGRRLPADPGHHRRRLQHGRRHRPAAGICEVSERTARRSWWTTPMPPACWGATAAGPWTTSTCTAGGHPGRDAVKAVGVLGGYVAGPAAPARLPGPAVAAVPLLHLAPAGRGRRLPRRLDVLEQEPERIDRLWENTRFFKAGLGAARLRHRRERDAHHPGYRPRTRRRRGASATASSNSGSSPGRRLPAPSPWTRRASAPSSPASTREQLGRCLAAFETVGRSCDSI